jgi:hypothetical protein
MCFACRLSSKFRPGVGMRASSREGIAFEIERSSVRVVVRNGEDAHQPWEQGSHSLEWTKARGLGTWSVLPPP